MTLPVPQFQAKWQKRETELKAELRHRAGDHKMCGDSNINEWIRNRFENEKLKNLVILVAYTFLEGKWITRRHHESGNVLAAMLTKCMLRIRFLQLKFPCQQVFGCQAGGFQHRATGWEYWVNTGSAWPSSFNSAYSCGVSMFCVFLNVFC